MGEKVRKRSGRVVEQKGMEVKGKEVNAFASKEGGMIIKSSRKRYGQNKLKDLK